MSLPRWNALLVPLPFLLAVAACSGGPPPEQVPTCTPSAAAELSCSDGRDDDCDGYVDCLDSECGGQTCADDGSTCVAGGCLCPGCALPGLPEIQNVRLTMHGDTAIIDFEPVEGALDYRVYPLPAAGAWHVDDSGALVTPDAIYRCGGDRPLIRREDDPAQGVDRSLAGMSFGYQRSEAESVLGYVYLTPGPGRQPVYRVGDPDGKGGFTWDYVVQPASEFSSADYVVGSAARDALLAAGGRDDGIAFYAPDDGTDGTRPIYRAQITGNDYSTHPVLYLTDGAEHDQRAGDTQVVELAERFRVLAAEAPGTVALHRVTYDWGNTFDVLAAGEPRFQRVLHQGNQPIWSVTWPGLTQDTMLVVEALDQGCPFPGGYISAAHADADQNNPYPSITVDEARLPATGEVFVNGQHEPANRPRPIARAYVQATPVAPPAMELYESFASADAWQALTTTTEDNLVRIRRNDRFIVEYAGCTENAPIGPVLGQLAFGGGDWGSSCNMSIIPRELQPELARDTFLHARMSTELPSSGRRYPQVLITTVPVAEPGSQTHSYDEPVRSRLGPLPFEEGYQPGSGSERTILVQPFGSDHELQIEFCDRRGWGVNVQCQRANLYGYHAGAYDEEWQEPWLPVPVMGDVAGFDRPVQLDVYASSERVYVFADDKPAGCAVLPGGHMPEGPVTVVFGAVIYHGAIDESVAPETSPHQFMRTFQPDYYTRRIDDLGLDRRVPAPAWDEAILPCATRWYGGDL
jgi:hypothetical protein